MKGLTSSSYYVIVLTTLWLTSSLLTSDAFAPNRRKRQASSLQQVQYENCGVMRNNAVISLVDLDVRPMPIRSPGKLKLSVRVNVTETLPTTLAVDVRVSKYMMGLPLKIPCYNSIGSCSYLNVCHLLNELRAHYGCPRFLTRHGIPCRCPVKAGLYSLLDLRFDIPALEGITSFLAKGKYEGEIRIYDQVTSLEYGCIRVTIAMKRRQKETSSQSLAFSFIVFTTVLSVLLLYVTLFTRMSIALATFSARLCSDQSESTVTGRVTDLVSEVESLHFKCSSANHLT